MKKLFKDLTCNEFNDECCTKCPLKGRDCEPYCQNDTPFKDGIVWYDKQIERLNEKIKFLELLKKDRQIIIDNLDKEIEV